MQTSSQSTCNETQILISTHHLAGQHTKHDHTATHLSTLYTLKLAPTFVYAMLHMFNDLIEKIAAITE